jgi:hypothetical protein
MIANVTLIVIHSGGRLSARTVNCGNLIIIVWTSLRSSRRTDILLFSAYKVLPVSLFATDGINITNVLYRWSGNNTGSSTHHTSPRSPVLVPRYVDRLHILF